MAVYDSSKSVAEICFENDQLRKENHYLRGNLRDEVARAVLPALLQEMFASVRAKEIGCPENWMVGVAIDSYRLADAMLEVREAK